MKMKDVQDKWWFNVFVVGVFGYAFYVFSLWLIVAIGEVWGWPVIVGLIAALFLCELLEDRKIKKRKKKKPSKSS